MENSILASLFVSGASATGRTGTERKREADDSFSGILAEKLQRPRETGIRPGRTDMAGRIASTGGRDKPGIRNRREQEADASLKPDLPGGRKDIGARRGAAAGSDSQVPGTEKTDEERKRELISEILLLLETLFSETYDALIGQNSSEGTDAGSSVSDLHQILRELPATLSGRLERLQELLDHIRTGTENGQGQDGLLALLDEIEELLAKMQDGLADRDTGGRHLEIIAERGGDLESLISQLQDQCREIAQRLRSMQEGETRAGTPETGVVRDDITDPAIEDAGQGRDAGKPEISSSDRKTGPGRETAGINDKAREAAVERTGTAENAEVRDGYETAARGQQAPDTGLSRGNIPAQRTEHTDFYLPDRQISQTVTSQVTMRIRLMAAENRQELEMHLKPDTLGRLTLKIIHERGQVLARITAENEQVKSILENNMQQLRDALEKNGYSVQSLEVSVRDQDSGNRQARRQEQGRRDRVEETAAGTAPGSTRRPERSGLYRIDIPGISRQIDLIA